MDEPGFRCSRCREVKPRSDFTMRGSSGGRPDTYCRPCRSAYGKEHYAANREIYIEQTRVRNMKYLRARVLWLLDYFKEHPCVDCGELDPVVLEFDHLRDKKFDIASSIHHRAWKTILDEIAKCQVVCANCHRRRTAKRRGALRLILSQAPD